MSNLDRRTFLQAGLGVGGLMLSSSLSRSWAQQGDPIKIGLIIPLTGATSQFGATMGQAAKIAEAEINGAGGVRGRPVQIVIEDDQSNPEAAVRAAHKLIDVDKVVSIGGSYASAVTSAIAPLCWEGKTALLTSSGADSITKLPHQGYIFRTSPTVTLQGTSVGKYAVELGGKRMFFLGPQTPFAQSYIDITSAIFKAAGGSGGGLIYEDKKSSYRSEVDQALKESPDVIVLGGYVPDTSVVLKDLYRAGYTGKKLGFSFGINDALTKAVPAEVSEGAYSLIPSAAENSEAYKRLIGKMGRPSLDSYSCQVYDHVVLTSLALARASSGEANGTAVRDNLRAISAGEGKRTDDAVEALKTVISGAQVNYDGPSGPLEFADNGDVKGVFFRYEQVQAGKLTLRKVG
ncbi:ABC transporter substrate-binding protein [Bradyrhizobium sp. AS23.2]|uniref:ABC transporter substrate-binding protein n=1 Tax=Bradyrhizobium sp. AS23.2 TaxID=1680155 RepID=UPI00093D80E1|nr:ABC transporter substrate-binding protein [Bradyrhizobium sp. AS23.2]OKO83682.1 ABC transporter substrate-binding protein [Bradyrhizobium sp. AS23.2]